MVESRRCDCRDTFDGRDAADLWFVGMYLQRAFLFILGMGS